MRLEFEWDDEQVGLLVSTLQRRHHQVRGHEEKLIVTMLRDIDHAQRVARAAKALDIEEGVSL